MFTSAVDIANRALQHCGVQRIVALTDDSVNASEINFNYDKLRRAELRRNLWKFSTRRAALRPITKGVDMKFVPPTYNAATKYYPGQIVQDANTDWWMNFRVDNVGNTPGIGDFWTPYFGPEVVTLWAAANSYYAGELVYKTPGDGTFSVYVSLQDTNQDDPALATAYDATVTYLKDQIVTFNSVAYIALSNFLLNKQPDLNPTLWSSALGGGNPGSENWGLINSASLDQINLIYPATDPSQKLDTSQNIFRLPHGFLRLLIPDPKAGSVSYIGAPSGDAYRDWKLEGHYIVSREVFPIVLRFIADVTYVPDFDDMFAEGLSARIALEVVERLTQSTAKLQAIGAAYKTFMTEARLIDAIERGATEPPVDDFISTRL